jgi:ribulose-phosphate 3-epimerase
MVEIIPAILPKSLTDLRDHLERIRGTTTLVQIDVVDGAFASNRTWPYSAPGSFEKITRGAEGLPYWEDFDFQFDLMVEHSLREAPCFIEAGGSSVVVHAASPDAHEAMVTLESLRGGDFGVAIGIALLPGATVSDLVAFEGLYDFVQIMGIKKVGFQSQPFDERTPALIQELRTTNPELVIQVDGGVSLKNARALGQAGANRLVCGSGIFAEPDPRAAYKALRTEANA